MSLEIIEIANRQRLDVFADGPGGANRLLIYTGVAVLGGHMWAMDNRLVHDTAEIILGPNSIRSPNEGDNFNRNPLTFINGSVSVALAAVVDLGDSENVTWAVDSTELGLIAIDADTKFLRIKVNCAFQGEKTALLRISYTAFIAAKDSAPDLTGLELNAELIVFKSDTPFCTGTVTISTPAPSAGVAVQLSTDRPDLLVIPSTVTVAAGDTAANFTVVLVANPNGSIRAEVTASSGMGHQSVVLELR